MSALPARLAAFTLLTVLAAGGMLTVSPVAAADDNCQNPIALAGPGGVVTGELGPGGHQWVRAFLEAGDYLFASTDGRETGVVGVYDGDCWNWASEDGYFLFYSPISYRAPASGYYSFLIYGDWGSDYVLSYAIADL